MPFAVQKRQPRKRWCAWAWTASARQSACSRVAEADVLRSKGVAMAVGAHEEPKAKRVGWRGQRLRARAAAESSRETSDCDCILLDLICDVIVI